MKIFKCTLLITAIFFFCSCEEEKEPLKNAGVDNSENYSAIMVQSESTCDLLSIEDECQFKLSDKCSCNLGGDADFEITGMFDYDAASKALRVADGKFKLSVSDGNGSRNYLYGNVIGETFKKGNNFRLTGIVRVTVGDGQLEASQGDLLLMIKGRKNNGAGSPYDLTIKVDGIIAN